MAKIFISYKYADDQVWQGLSQEFWAEETNDLTGIIRKENKATGRAYVNFLEKIIGKENILKGEKQDESLDRKSEDQVWEILKPRIHDSSITLVVISKGMKDIFQDEEDQWMPTEIRYSLWEISNGGKRSSTNALLGIIIPDNNRSYEYIYKKSDCPHCGHIKVLDKHRNPYLFNIIRRNIFNRKNENTSTCQGAFCNSTIYEGDHSYMHLVTLEEFIKEKDSPQKHIDIALKIKELGEKHYDIEKSI